MSRKNLMKRKTWAGIPQDFSIDPDEATNDLLQKEKKGMQKSLRRGLSKITRTPNRVYDYKTAQRKRQSIEGGHFLGPITWTSSKESEHEVKIHIRKTSLLLKESEWGILFDKGVTNLIIEDEENVLDSIPADISRIQTMRSLTLIWSKIKILPAHLLMMNLTELYIQKCILKDIDGIHQMNNLETLEISSGFLKRLPKKIGDIASLRSLDLAGNKLDTLPSSMGKMALNNLKISANSLTEFPLVITEMGKLTSLDASQNQIKELPGNIGALANLVTLTMSHNQLYSLPQSTKHLRNLKNLFLGNNLFTSIPETLIHTVSLQTLNLTGNQIHAISVSLPQVTTLILDRNHLDLLQTPLFGFSSLEKLSLQFNKIARIPPEIKHLTKLRALYLRRNPLERLPDEICRLRELRHLILRETKLKELPSMLDSLCNLSVLELAFTDIQEDYLVALQTHGVQGLMRFIRMKNMKNVKTGNFSQDETEDAENSDNEIPEPEDNSALIAGYQQLQNEEPQMRPGRSRRPQYVVSMFPTDHGFVGNEESY